MADYTSLFDKKGIALAAGFDYQAEFPLDSRFISKTKAEMESLITEHAVYPHLHTYCLEDHTYYKYNLESNTFIPANAEETEKFEELLKALNDEIARAKAAEGVLQDNIDAEEAARIAADTTLQQNIDTLRLDALLDAELIFDTNNLLKEVTLKDGTTRKIFAERAQHDAENNDIIATYATKVENEAVDTKIDAEIKRSTAKDTEHDTKIQENATSIANEIARATEAEETLQTNIDTEEAARIEKDTDLQNQITAEVNRSTTKDTEHDNKIAKEIADRTSGDTNLQNQVDTINDTAFFKAQMSTDKQTIDFINAENIKVGAIAVKDIGLLLKTDTTTGIIQLTDSIGNILSSIDTYDERIVKSAHFDANTEELVIEFYSGDVVKIPLSSMTDKIRYYFADETTLTLDTSNPDKYTFKISDAYKELIAKIVPNEERLTIVENGLAAEITRAKAAEEQLQKNIDAEKTRATAAETTLQENIDDLESRSVLDSDLRFEDNGLINSIVNGDQTSAIFAERAQHDADGNDISSTYATKDENSGVEEKLDAEIERSTAKDTEHDAGIKTNANAIAAETTRATSEEQRIEGKVDSETERATAAEETLQTNIDTLESEALLDSEITLDTKSNLIESVVIGGTKRNIEAERAINDENGNNIVNTYATKAEKTALEAKVDAEIKRSTDTDTDHDTRIKANADAIAAETARAVGEETRIEGKVDSETERATTAEEGLQQQLDEGLVRNIARYKDTTGTDVVYGVQYEQNGTTIQSDIFSLDSDYFDKNQLLAGNNLVTLNPTWLATLATQSDIAGIIKDTSLTIENGFVTKINNTNLFANKATNDSDGNPINTTYLKSATALTTYIKKAGDTFTGNLTASGTGVTVTAPVISATDYLKTRVITSESSSDDVLHSIKLGYTGNNKLTFNETGGIFEFNHVNALSAEYENQSKTILSLNTNELIFRQDTNKFNADGSVADNSLVELLKVNATNIYYKGNALALDSKFGNYVLTSTYNAGMATKQNNLTTGKFINLDTNSKIEGRTLYPMYHHTTDSGNYSAIQAIETEYGQVPLIVKQDANNYYFSAHASKETNGYYYRTLTFDSLPESSSDTFVVTGVQTTIDNTEPDATVKRNYTVYTKGYIDNTLEPRINNKINLKQDKLTAGANIQIQTVDNILTISATDTTYSQATNTYAGINKFYNDANKGTMIADDGAISPLAVAEYIESLDLVSNEALTGNGFATKEWVENQNYLQTVPDEYLTETEGDNRYWQKTDIPDHVVTTNTAQNIYGEKSFNNGISIAANNETETLSASDKVKMTYNATKKCLQFMFS